MRNFCANYCLLEDRGVSRLILERSVKDQVRMESPADANDVQTSHEPHVPAANTERIDQVLDRSTEPQVVTEDEEMANQSEEKSLEVQNSDQVAEPPSKPQIETEEAVTQPSLESVWKSLQAAETSQTPSFEPRDIAQQKGVVSERSPISSEVQSKPETTGRKPSALRTRPSTRAKRSVTFKDDFEEPGQSLIRKSGIRRQAEEGHLRVLPGCIGVFLSVALAFLVVYISTPTLPTKPVSNHHLQIMLLFLLIQLLQVMILLPYNFSRSTSLT